MKQNQNCAPLGGKLHKMQRGDFQRLNKNGKVLSDTVGIASLIGKVYPRNIPDVDALTN